MRLMLMRPAHLLFEGDVEKVSLRGREGSLTLLPRHIDYTTIIEPGVLIIVPVGGERQYIAVSDGVLTKCGDELRIAVRDAFRGPDLEGLLRSIRDEFIELDERESKARQALARMEADFIHHYMEIGEG